MPTAQGPGLDSPSLIVRGKIAGTTARYLDLKSIMALPSVSFSSVDPWDGKVHSFTGVPLAALLASLGIDSSATGLVSNGQEQLQHPIKRKDYEEYGYLLAYMIDGRLFSEDSSTIKRGPWPSPSISPRTRLFRWIYTSTILFWQITEILVQ